MTWYKYDMMRKIIKCRIDKFFKETRLFNSPLVLLSKGYLVSLSFFLFLPFFCSSLSLFLSLSLSLSLCLSFLSFSTTIPLISLHRFSLSLLPSLYYYLSFYYLSLYLCLSLSLSLSLSLFLFYYLSISLSICVFLRMSGTRRC